MPAETRQLRLAGTAPRLLMVRAVCPRPDDCDPDIEHLSAELPGGFIELFEHIDGFTPLRSLLDGLTAAGAGPALLGAVSDGFRRLLDAGLLETAPE